MDRTFCGDGSESVRGRVGMGVKSAGMGGDGTKIPSPCTPLLYRRIDALCDYIVGPTFTYPFRFWRDTNAITTHDTPLSESP